MTDKEKKISFSVPGKPRGQGRPRFGNGRAYKKGEDVAYEAEIAKAAKDAAAEAGIALPVTDDERGVSLRVDAYFPVPSSKPKWWKAAALGDRIRPEVKPDLDNVIKAVMDALNGVAWGDDSHVTCLWAAKAYSSQPRLSVALFWQEPAEGKRPDQGGE